LLTTTEPPVARMAVVNGEPLTAWTVAPWATLMVELVPEAVFSWMTESVALLTRPATTAPEATVIVPPPAELATMAGPVAEMTLPRTFRFRPPVPDEALIAGPLPEVTAPVLVTTVEPEPVEVATMPEVAPETAPPVVTTTGPFALMAWRPMPVRPVMVVPGAEVTVTAPLPVEAT
jgi:hypothetical protein